VSKAAKDWTRRVGNERHLICIEDPFDVTHDLGRVVDHRSIGCASSLPTHRLDIQR
jgi:hypothetical protein